MQPVQIQDELENTKASSVLASALDWHKVPFVFILWLDSAHRKWRQPALVLSPRCHTWQLFCDSGKDPAVALLNIIAGNALTERRQLDRAAAQLTASLAGGALAPPPPRSSPGPYLALHMHPIFRMQQWSAETSSLA